MYLHPAPLVDTLDALQAGQHSLTLYVEEMLERMDEVDPHIHAFLPEPGRRQRLLQAVHDLKAHYPQPGHRPPLYGLLVGVKDIFHVDGFATQAGSALPPERLAGSEAAAVTRLREAGALILGKTTTTEFAYFEPGPTRNPHNLGHTPGGSSSGSAAAVAAGLCPLALGTQTIGSVIRPAAFCGIVGFKPTYERIPTRGLVYFSRTADHVGLFTQDVAGMIRVAAVLCDGWQTVAGPAGLPVLGVPDGPYLEQTAPEALGAFEHYLTLLQRLGCTVRRVSALHDIAELNQLHRRLVFAEFAREHEVLYAEYAHLYRPRTAEIVEIGRGVSEDQLAEAQEHVRTLRARLEEQMDAAGIDLWICPPAVGPAPAGIEATGDPNMNLPWTHAGMPVVTLPAGRDEAGLPLGLQFVARFGADEDLLAWSLTLEGAIGSAADPGDVEGQP